MRYRQGVCLGIALGRVMSVHGYRVTGPLCLGRKGGSGFGRKEQESWSLHLTAASCPVLRRVCSKGVLS
jgi:hypothetical protein